MRSDPRSITLRAFAILDAVARSERGLTLTEIVELARLPKPSVHRILGMLEGGGFLLRGPESRLFEPGPAFRRLGLAVVSSAAGNAGRRGVLGGLNQLIGETCALAMLDGPEVVYIDRVESSWPLRFDLPVGSRLPLHSTAAGKLLLALLPTAQRNRVIATLSLTRSSPRTITDPARLAAHLESIRAEGCATDDEEYLPGLICLAIPVAAKDFRTVAALTIQIPAARATLEAARTHLPELRRAAALLSTEFNLTD